MLTDIWRKLITVDPERCGVERRHDRRCPGRVRRTANVETVGRVAYPPADHLEVLEVRTDLPVSVERAFYLDASSPLPVEGQTITWGDRHAWYMVNGQAVVARKVWYAFDPDQALR